MSELIIRLKGEVTDTNFDEWKNDLLARLKKVNTELASDDDFANAESDVKTIKAGEVALKNAKASALEQADEIQKLFAAIDEVSSEARDARLALERQIKKRKAEMKDEIVDTGLDQIKTHIEEQSTELQSVNHSWLDRSAFEDEIKGKRTTSSMQKAITGLQVKIKNEIAEREDSINANRQVLDKINDDHSALFQDKESLLLMDGESLQATIDERIEYFEAENQKQSEAAPEVPDETEETAEENTNDVKEEEPETEDTPVYPTDELHVISIEMFAEVDAAQQLFDEIDDLYSNREIVSEIKLS